MLFSFRENRLRISKMAKANKTTLVVVLTVLLIATTSLLLWSLIRGRRPNFLIDAFNAPASSKEDASVERVPYGVNNTKNNTVNKFKNSAKNQNKTDDYLDSTLPANVTNGIVKKNSNDSPLAVLRKVVIVTSTCELKSCSSANMLFYNMASNIITNQLQFSSIKRLKCKMGEFAAAEEKLNTSTGSRPPCYYTSSETFLSPHNVQNVGENRDALKIYLNIYKELLSSLLPMSKKEGEVSTREKLLDQLLSLEKTIQSLIFDLDNVLQDLSACSCSQQSDKSTSSKVYTQSYQQLASKFSHTKSAFVTLKQLEAIYKAMKEDLWQRQGNFLFAC